MSYTTPQRVRPTASSRSSVSLHTSFAQIRRIHPSNTFVVLAVHFMRHRIDQKDSDTLRHNSVQTTKQVRGTLLPPSTLRLVYLLYELPNRLKGLSPSGILRLAIRATKQARRVSSGTFTACCTSYRTGQTDFYPLVLLRLARLRNTE